jgi:hypothetical protein
MPLAPCPARLYVMSFVGAIAVCGALSVEAWPFTSWRLFSRERQPIAASWTATSVDARGRETPIRFGRFSKPNRNFVLVMSSYERMSPHEREATCRAWARLVRRHGGDAAGGLRLYATTRDLRRHVGRRAPVTPVARLRWTCAGGRGARAAGGATARSRPAG